MKILINSKPLCEVSNSATDELFDMLTRHNFKFHLDEKYQTVNIPNPFQGYIVYLENGNATIKSGANISKASSLLLENVYDRLARLGFDVFNIADEEMKKKMLRKQVEGLEGIWLSILNHEHTGNGISAYFTFHQMKQSKQLANIVLQSIVRHTDLPVNSVLFEWKNVMNYILPMSAANQLPTVLLECDELDAARDSHRLDQLSQAIPKAIAAYCNQAAFLEVIQFCQSHKYIPEQRQNDAAQAVENHEETIRETVPGQPSEQTANHRASPAPNHSTFSWMLHQQAIKGDRDVPPKTISSFIAYMNKLSQVDNAMREKDQHSSVNMLTLDRKK